MRKAIGRSLRALGLRVIEAGSPSEALARWGDGSGIDVVVTDVVMPEMSGVELVRRMRQRRPVRVLYTTGYTDEVVAEHGILGAGELLLQKPFTNEALSARLGQVLAR